MEEPCKRFVNVNRRGGFGLRGLLAAARVENDAMDRKQVARAQKRLESDPAGRPPRQATLIYDVFKKDNSGPKPSSSSDAKKARGFGSHPVARGLPPLQLEVSLREPDPELDTLWAPVRCVCHCGCRAELGNGEGSRCKDCRRKGPRHQRFMEQHDGQLDSRPSRSRSRSRSWQRPRISTKRRSRKKRKASSSDDTSDSSDDPSERSSSRKLVYQLSFLFFRSLS
eukprot:symbB.v1.2.037810.t1/scaffold5689.1/size24566/3